MSDRYFIGWDVGAWYCDENRKSRDALVVLNENGDEIGQPYRGNITASIESATTSNEWIRKMANACKVSIPDRSCVTLAIDAPLGFPAEFITLAADLLPVNSVGGRNANRYLFRQTERNLLGLGWKPLSAIEAMIGSQATKGMHVLSKFANVRQSCGIWTDGCRFTAIETYPTPCRMSPTIKGLLEGRKELDNNDTRDARICALVAYIFGRDRRRLAPPTSDVPDREGWIWIPDDVTPPT